MKNYSERYKFLCIESIYCVDGHAPLLELHQERVNRTLVHLYNSSSDRLTIKIPEYEWEKSKVYKLRVVYNPDMCSVQAIPYSPKLITSAILIENNDIDYSYKFYNRDVINTLTSSINNKNNSEIIIVKDGCITDSSYHNLVFRKGKKFYTPKNPLLHGVQREFLMSIGYLEPIDILVSDLPDYDECYFINALNSIDNCNHIPVSEISY